MSFEIDIYNQYKLDENKKYDLCPICSHTRSPEGQKQKCLMTNWERGIATCQHCKTVIQLHKYKGVKNDFQYYVPPVKKTKPKGSFHSMEFLDEVSFKYGDKNNFSTFLEDFFTQDQIFDAEQAFLIFSTNDYHFKSICYPFISEKEDVTGIKVMAYDEKGNRRRNSEGD